jgi:hypothetical protein
MAHKRKDTISQKKVEYAKHLRPFEKRVVAKAERRAAIDFIRKQKEEHCVKQDFETAARFRDVQRILEGA